jgi:hypothetical protein
MDPINLTMCGVSGPCLPESGSRDYKKGYARDHGEQAHCRASLLHPVQASDQGTTLKGATEQSACAIRRI